jgi:hypothetical protein
MTSEGRKMTVISDLMSVFLATISLRTFMFSPSNYANYGVRTVVLRNAAVLETSTGFRQYNWLSNTPVQRKHEINIGEMLFGVFGEHLVIRRVDRPTEITFGPESSTRVDGLLSKRTSRRLYFMAISKAQFLECFQSQFIPVWHLEFTHLIYSAESMVGIFDPVWANAAFVESCTCTC